MNSKMDKTEVLSEVIISLFEKWAMMFEGFSNAEDQSKDVVIVASLNFTGEKTGVLDVVIPKAALIEVGQNLLGVDADYEFGDDEINDVAGEFVNLVCGHFVSHYYGENVEIILDQPKVRQDLDPMSVDEVMVNIEGHVVRARVN